MRKLLAALFVSIAVLGASVGCGPGRSVELPDEPVPMPASGPETAGSSLPGSEPQTPP